jgi:hypothetical protein
VSYSFNTPLLAVGWFICTTAQFGEESSIIGEVSPEDLGYAKNEMTVCYGLEDFFTDPFPNYTTLFW